MTTGAPGVYVGMLREDAGISTELTITPGQRVSVSGDPTLARAPHWGADNSCGAWARDGVCRDGGPNQDRDGLVFCDLGTDSADCGVASAGNFVVQARGSLALRHVGLGDSTLALSTGGSLSLSSMAVPEAWLSAATSGLGGAGSTLRLAEVTVPEYRSDDSCNDWANDGHCQDGGPNQDPAYNVDCTLGTDATDCGTPPAPPPQSLAITVGGDGSWAVEGSLRLGSPVFAVSSGRTCSGYGTYADTTDYHSAGDTDHSICLEYDDTPPCEISQGGRCVGRAQGYGPSEECAITVSGGSGVLGACSVFDMGDVGDDLTLPDGSRHGDSDCPAGALLAPGDALSSASNGDFQGSVGMMTWIDGIDIDGTPWDNGCAAKGTCGLPGSNPGLGGGWQICFA